MINTTDDRAKSGWRRSDSNNGTMDVFGSVSQYQAPAEIEHAAIAKTTKWKICIKAKKLKMENLLLHRSVEGWRQAITSVSLRSNALRSARENLD